MTVKLLTLGKQEEYWNIRELSEKQNSEMLLQCTLPPHSTAWEKSEIIDQESNWERRVKEALHIMETSNALNSDPGHLLNLVWITCVQR